jgi:hypothetical protein
MTTAAEMTAPPLRRQDLGGNPDLGGGDLHQLEQVIPASVLYLHHHHHHASLLKSSIKEAVCFGLWTVPAPIAEVSLHLVMPQTFTANVSNHLGGMCCKCQYQVAGIIIMIQRANMSTGMMRRRNLAPTQCRATG